MRLCLVLIGMVLVLAACSSHPAPRLATAEAAPRATAEAPIVPLVAEEEASVTASSKPPDAPTARRREGSQKTAPKSTGD
jgi:hypothetical protein